MIQYLKFFIPPLSFIAGGASMMLYMKVSKDNDKLDNNNDKIMSGSITFNEHNENIDFDRILSVDHMDNNKIDKN